MFIEILYDDLSRQRAKIEESDKLSKTGVLAIIFSCVDEENPRATIDGVGYRRRGQWGGKDFYYLLHYKDEGDDWYGMDARDRGEFVKFYKSANPWNEIATRQEHPRYGCSMIVFEGSHVSDEEWTEAMKLFEEEMH